MQLQSVCSNAACFNHLSRIYEYCNYNGLTVGEHTVGTSPTRSMQIVQRVENDSLMHDNYSSGVHTQTGGL